MNKPFYTDPSSIPSVDEIDGVPSRQGATGGHYDKPAQNADIGNIPFFLNPSAIPPITKFRSK